MLDTNQGLKSRFKRFIDFPDWHPSDCTKYFQSMARTDNFVLEEPEQSMPIIEKGFKKLLPLKGWGNARDVSKLYESVCEYRAQRLRKDRAQGNETSLEKICLKEDITMAMDAMISARMGTGGARRKVSCGKSEGKVAATAKYLHYCKPRWRGPTATWPLHFHRISWNWKNHRRVSPSSIAKLLPNC